MPLQESWYARRSRLNDVAARHRREWAAVHHNGLSRALTETAAFAGAGALVAAARGSFRGRVRRAMWRYPPPWLDNEQAEEA